MRAMILAAGRGERMRPLSDTLPKPLLRAGKHSLIEWQIRRLVAAGIHEIVINHAWLGAAIEAALGDGAALGAQLRYSAESRALETAGGIRLALALLGDAPFAAVSADIYCEYDYRRLVDVAATLQEGEGPCAHLVLTANPPYHPDGDMALQDGHIRRDGSRLTYANIGVFHPEIFRVLPPGEKRALFPWLYQFVDSGQVTGELYQGRWENIGTPEQLQALDALLTAASARDFPAA